jgi:hypothetical protein
MVYNPSELAALPEKIKSSSDHNPVPFCNAVQSLEASIDDDPAASWTALLALRPANDKANENAAATINKLRLADTTVGDYTRLHRAAHTALTIWTPATTMPPY